jgi:hypothetical protein
MGFSHDMKCGYSRKSTESLFPNAHPGILALPIVHLQEISNESDEISAADLMLTGIA